MLISKKTFNRLAIFGATFSFAGILGHPAIPAKLPSYTPNVILITLDGVRWQEAFHGADPSIDPTITNEFKDPLLGALMDPAGKKTWVSGDRLFREASQAIKNAGHEREIRVANPEIISLPAYQTIMSGKTTECASNSCGRVRTETLHERLVSELKLQKTAVATFSSWPEIGLAVEQNKGRTVVNCGNERLTEGMMNSTVLGLNELQDEDTPSWSGRKDRYTFAQALHYLKNNRPRFLYISLNDADEYGHQGKYLSYLMTLKWYAEQIQDLYQVLDELGDYGRATSVLITTDHGRGLGKNWKRHGADYPEAQYIWMIGRHSEFGRRQARGVREQNQLGKLVSDQARSRDLTHLDIRPTIEKLMGLAPSQCPNCGSVIEDFFR